jgi:hypothetical protein
MITNQGVIVVNVLGDIKLQYELLDSHNTRVDMIIEKDNEFLNYFTYTQPYMFKIDKTGNIKEKFYDKSYSFIWKWGPIIHDLGMYYLGGDGTGRTVETFLYKYNNEMQQIDSMMLDYSKIPYSTIKARLPRGIITKDSFLLVIDWGPENTRADTPRYSVIIKYDMKCNYIWSQKIEQNNSNYTSIAEISESLTGDYLVFGFENYKNKNIFLSRLSKDGKILMQTIIPSERWQHTNGCKEIQNGKYIVCFGDTANNVWHDNSDFWLSILDSSGEVLQKYIWNINGKNEIKGVAEKENGNLVIYGKHGYDSVYLAEIEIDLLKVKEESPNNRTLNISINPLTNNISLNIFNENSGISKIEIYNLLGVKLQEYKIELQAGENNLPIDINSLSCGVYIIVLKDNYRINSQRFLIN